MYTFSSLSLVMDTGMFSCHQDAYPVSDNMNNLPLSALRIDILFFLRYFYHDLYLLCRLYMRVIAYFKTIKLSMNLLFYNITS